MAYPKRIGSLVAMIGLFSVLVLRPESLDGLPFDGRLWILGFSVMWFVVGYLEGRRI